MKRMPVNIKLVLSVTLACLTMSISGQPGITMGLDCNPKLNDQEISYLANMFPANNFDFKNKNIGFAAHRVKKICRVPTFILSGSWPIDKKDFFQSRLLDSCNTTYAKLIVLNEEQKKITKGFDAIVLVVKKKKEHKIDTRMTDRFIEVFGYRTLNYPDNLHLVGNDNSNGLTNEDAILFNRIYHDKGFDFKDKKIAFMNPHLGGKESIRTKKEFIEKIKKHLETDFLYPASEELEILSAEEKKETGYDAIIIYQAKRTYRNLLIQTLKENKDR